MSVMIVLLVGTPELGYEAFGPFESSKEAEANSDLACRQWGGSGWALPLEPAPQSTARSAAEWRMRTDACVVSDGDISQMFWLVGPFENSDEAYAWARANEMGHWLAINNTLTLSRLNANSDEARDEVAVS